MGGDDPEREKLSWSEIDRRRNGARQSADRPRGAAAREASAREQRDALADANALFAGDGGGAEGAELGRAVRDAHGTAALADACRAYVGGVGTPKTIDLLQIFLDSDDRALMLRALASLLELRESGNLAVSSGLKSQLRVLAQSSDDDVAGLSEDLLA